MKKKISVVSCVLVLITVLAVPMPALAAPTGTTTVSGTVGATIDLTAVPGAQDFGTMVVGNNDITSLTVTVDCNVSGWSLGAGDLRGGGAVTPGSMDNGSTALTNALQIRGGDQTTYIALSGSTVYMLEDGIGSTAGTTSITNVAFRQVLDISDSPGTYNITVTFTATTP